MLLLNVLALGVLIALLAALLPALLRGGNQPLPPLEWAQRSQWPPLARAPAQATLKYDMLVAAETGKQHPTRKAFLLHPEAMDPAAIEAALRRAATLAASEAFDAPDTLDELYQLHEQARPSFYLDWLIGTWHDRAGKPDQAQHWFAQAFAKADVALMLGQADAQDPPLAIALDRIIHRGKAIDQSLALVYPATTPQPEGPRLLPCYKAAWRIVDPKQAGLNQPGERWFACPARIVWLDAPNSIAFPNP